MLTTICYGKKKYTLSIDDFKKQFNKKLESDWVFCRNEGGNLVWLHLDQFSILIAVFKDKTEKKLLINSIRYYQDTIQALEYNVWLQSNRVNKYNLNEVSSFEIEFNLLHYVRPYFNCDSIKTICYAKNDSLNKIYSNGNEKILLLILKEKQKKDTILIVENACYNIRFKDNSETNYGVVQKITSDSIFITNSFNKNMSTFFKKEFEIYKMPINEISEIKLFKFRGYSFKSIGFNDFIIETKERKKDVDNIPMWYSFYTMQEEISFYRCWLTERGFAGIKEKDGKPIWLEQ